MTLAHLNTRPEGTDMTEAEWQAERAARLAVLHRDPRGIAPGVRLDDLPLADSVACGAPLLDADGLSIPYHIETPPAPEMFCFAWLDGTAYRPLLTFHRDGRVELGEGLTPDEGARLTLDALRGHFAAWIGTGRDGE